MSRPLTVEGFKRKFLRGNWPPKGIDETCTLLCSAINKIPGIVTVESCEGHDKQPFRIWLRAQHLGVLPPLLYWLDGCHTGFYGWAMRVRTDCACSPVSLCIEGPSGPERLEQANSIATEIFADLRKNREDFKERYLDGLKRTPAVFR